jgi:hypothetical protein
MPVPANGSGAQVQGKGAADSPNPVALSDAQALAKELKVVLGEPPEWLTSKIAAPGVHFAAIGGETSMFRLASELVDSPVITKVRLLEAVENLCGKSDLQLRLMEDVPAAMNQPQLVSAAAMVYIFLPCHRLLALPSLAYHPVPCLKRSQGCGPPSIHESSPCPVFPAAHHVMLAGDSEAGPLVQCPQRPRL